MEKRIFNLILIFTMWLLLMMACDNTPSPTSFTDKSSDNGSNSETVPNEGFTKTVSDALTENYSDHEIATDYNWNAASATEITLNSSGIAISGNGAKVEGSTLKIKSAGTYRIKGSLDDGRILVDNDDDGIVRLVLDGVNIHCSTSAPIFIKNAKKTIIVLADGNENYVSDGAAYVFDDPEDDEPNAAIFSNDDVTIYGNGALKVDAQYNDGITGKDGLIIAGGEIVISAADDGIRGKDYLIIKDATITVKAGGDGLKSDNDADVSKGYIDIESGTLNITASGDAIQAETDALIRDGEFNIVAGGGSSVRLNEDVSAKAIKAEVYTIVDGGNFTINATDDAIHSNNSLAINDGTFLISTGDDAIHADTLLGINGGNIQINKSYEGIESQAITINDGTINIFSSDDGINAADGSEGDGMNGGPGGGGMPPVGNFSLKINGGYIAIQSVGDGIDINGSVDMTGGVLLVNGPTANMNGALDYNRYFKITGGTVIAAGSSGMAQAPGTSSTQYSVLINFRSALAGGTVFHIQTSVGEDILSFVPVKNYQSIAFSLPELRKGTTYDVYYGGNITGTENDGLYTDCVYSPGTKFTSFTINNVITNVYN
ncbi:carbohydrate-binding domain-containing protein [candidate division KSB1 bacterium]|nr:carbohydrate-binding domain-containing protein [candidate division KSB1 bacterium]